MRILHVVPSYYPATYWGGTISSVYAMNNALAAKEGIELKVLTTDAAGSEISNRLNIKKMDKNLFPNQEILFTSM